MSRKTEKKALVIGAGPWQVPLISFLQNKGYFVASVDKKKECEGGLISNQYEAIDVYDVDEIVNRFRDKGYSIVTGDQSDSTIETVAAVSARLGVRGNSLQAVETFVDKTKARSLARNCGISQPEFATARGEADVLAFMEAHQGPFILKPADGQSSRGVFRLTKSDRRAVSVAVPSCLGCSRQKKMIIEEFVRGKEVTIEGLCSQGRHKCMAISIKDHFRTAIASKLRYPAQLPQMLEAKLCAAIDKFVEESGLVFGITHTEMFVNLETHDYWLVEIACRGGGTLISSHIGPWVSGVNFYEVLFSDLEGQPVDVRGLKPKTRGALLGFFEFSPGRVKAIEGIDSVRKWEGVHCLNLDFKVGDTIKAANDDSSRQGFAILFRETAEEVESLWEKVRLGIKVTSA